MKSVAILRQQYEQLKHTLTERSRREWAASEAMALGYGGISRVHEATGLVPSTIGKGIKELKARESKGGRAELEPGRIRRRGGGRRKAVDKDPTLTKALEELVDPVTRGDPESPLRWVSRSLRQLSTELQQLGYKASRNVVARTLKSLGYSLQGNRKTKEGASHPDRNAQFEHINKRVGAQLQDSNPVISVDTKKKENVGDFKNGGREYRPKGDPEQVRVHDFMDKVLGKVSPYGIYDIARNNGWVNVGTSADTAEFAVASIRSWWEANGRVAYPKATELLITADGGGSNGYRVRLWKRELQRFADDIGIPVSVCHLPPGTSKWNKIEHRLFSFISINWRGKPLTSYETIIKLISSTTTTTGLTVQCELDETEYAKGRKVSDEEMAALNIVRDKFHRDWNYTLIPKQPRRSVRVRRRIDRLVS